MTTTIRNMMMGLVLAGSMFMVTPASAQMATHRTRPSGSHESVSSRSESASRDRQMSTSTRRESASRAVEARRESATTAHRESASRSAETRRESVTRNNDSRSNDSRSAQSMNNNRPRPETSSYTRTESSSRDNGNRGNYNGGNDRRNGDNGNRGNYNSGNDRRNGDNGNRGNYNGGNDRRNNGNGNYSSSRPGGYRPESNRHHESNRGHNAYRDHYSWNYAHNNWSRPLPPPARAHRPAPYVYHRPHIPVGYRPHRGAPIIDRILGITFGTLFDASLNYLYTNGYYIDGYNDGVVYLRDVNMLNLAWADVMLCYDDYGRLYNAQFIHSNYYNDRSRYNRLYHDLCAIYGTPIEIDRGGVTWFGGNSVGYVTLSISCTGSRYYTNLFIGN